MRIMANLRKRFGLICVCHSLNYIAHIQSLSCALFVSSFFKKEYEKNGAYQSACNMRSHRIFYDFFLRRNKQQAKKHMKSGRTTAWEGRWTTGYRVCVLLLCKRHFYVYLRNAVIQSYTQLCVCVCVKCNKFTKSS